MTLACSHSYAYGADEPWLALLKTTVWCAALVMPFILFLILPKLLPLRRELRWTRARMLHPLAWLASRMDGNHREANGWRARIGRAWRVEVEARNGSGMNANVVRDPRLFARAIAGGRMGFAAVGIVYAVSVGVLFSATHNRIGTWWSIALTLALPAAAVVGWIGGSAGAMVAQSLALGKKPLRRAGAGLLAAIVYGPVTGFVSGVVGSLIVVPFLSLVLWDPPPARDWLEVLTVAGVGAAVVGLMVAIVVFVPLALLARKKPAALLV